MTNNYLSAPFPYFGGKAKVADLVWEALGQPRHYMEPFFGSGAVLLRRPDYDHQRHIETVCDIDGFVANVWRSIQFSPDETARWCDWPINHVDLMARKRNLLENESRLLVNLIADPEWHDPKLAGYWIWAASCWIGYGLEKLNTRPHISTSGNGVHRLRYRSAVYTWFRVLSERLRHVRVVCGDWTRICRGKWQDIGGGVGIFFDPPYGVKDRDTNVYRHDSTAVSKEVEKWCLERGKMKGYRIVVAGYIEEYEGLKEAGWKIHRWKTHGGFGNITSRKDNQGKINRKREALFFSPHCLNQKGLFDSQP